MKMGFGMITALLVLSAVFCVSGTVMSKEKQDRSQENARYALLEDTFKESARRTLEELGYHNSGLTVTWTRDADGRRSYRVEVHHSRIQELEDREQAQLTEILLCEDFCKEVEDLCIIYH
ncbi:MAG: hypothetical protein K2N37_08755 [Lachnospiraceae bacterium]|nr:hypothetical protein [Lachnospiraceae bacterium]